MSISNKVIILIRKASIIIDKKSNVALSPYNLTNAQYRILKMIYFMKESVRQIDIEKEFCLTNPTVTGIVKNLENKGLVKRIANPNDKRSKIIVLTEKSISMMDCLNEVGDNLEEDITKNLTRDERKQLLKLLKKIFDNEEKKYINKLK